MGILPKGGINVAGHKIPWEAIAAIAGVAGVILVIRARQQGGQVAAVGQAPATSAIDPSLLGFGSTSPDVSGALANLSAQLTALQQQGINSAPAGPAAAPAPSSTWGLLDPSNPNALVPLASTLGARPAVWLRQGTQVSLVGAPQPFTYGGQSYLGQEVNVNGTDFWANALNLPAGAI